MGVVNNKYRKHEVKRLSLYISRIKFRPLIWRNTHPYVVADRVEDVTTVARINEEGAQCDRDVTLYGYVRGSHLKASMKIHLIGAGDFEIASISALPDPCPLPGGKGDKNTVSLKTKKDNLLYAPLANIGRVSMDKDGLYIEIKNVHYTKKEHLHLSDMQQGESYLMFVFCVVVL
jgi:ribosome biogenesis protein BMS1